ncbi:uncharacterized protein LOC131166561 [Malania oleifera]|uniref:uncharacterized protein LOC131166561 n=1 Tax=Malania oleifera TaxID=397392 RepID=UPI0025AE44BC|nr:uncharacterized protein LOC131166561 [Malania oleifera]
MVMWNPQLVKVITCQVNSQAIHSRIKCQITSNEFIVSFIYGFNSLVKRRDMWRDLIQMGSVVSGPWLLLGEFNYVMCSEQKRNRIPPSEYEIKDIRDFSNEVRLCDLKSKGNWLTWTNGKVWCKLDHVVVNQDWKGTGENTFKFFNMWKNHENFKSTIDLAWNLKVDGHYQFRLVKKLQSLKTPLKALNKLHFSHISSRAERASEELNEIQERLHKEPMNLELQRDLGDKRKQAVMLEEASRQFLAQMAKSNYLKNCDRGSACFHAILKRRSARNHIVAITKQNRELTESFEEVANEFVDFYMQLLGEGQNCSRIDEQVLLRGPVLKDNIATLMVALVTDEEVKNAIFNIDERKFPGPDGFSSGFFKESWGIVGRDVVDSVILLLQGEEGAEAWGPTISFALCLEYLSRKLRTLEGKFYFRGDSVSVKLQMDCLSKFYKCSGLSANNHKSSLYQTGIKKQNLEEILRLIGFNLGEFPFRYLGIPLLASRLNSVHYSPVIVKLCRAFLWGGRKKPLVAWHDLRVPKLEGGLGILDLSSRNKALLTKALLNVHSKKDSLWSKWVHHVYLRDFSIWEVAAKKEDSNLFKKLVEVRDLLAGKCGSLDNALELMRKWDLDSHQYYEF